MSRDMTSILIPPPHISVRCFYITRLWFLLFMLGIIDGREVKLFYKFFFPFATEESMVLFCDEHNCSSLPYTACQFEVVHHNSFPFCHFPVKCVGTRWEYNLIEIKDIFLCSISRCLSFLKVEFQQVIGAKLSWINLVSFPLDFLRF